MRCLRALRDNGWEVEIKQKEHGASVHHSWKATADVSEEQAKVGELSTFFFNVRILLKSYLSDLRGKLSYKIAHTFSVLRIYFSFKIFRKISFRAVPCVIPALYCYVCQLSIHE